MKVSIIIPAYNAEKYLARTLESVLAQTFTAWELVVMDDGSSDGTRDIAEAYAAQDGRIRVVHQKNGGVAVARREGFARTLPTTEAVIFLDNDDVWEPEALAAMTEVLEKNPDAIGAYVLARYVDGQGMPIRVGEMEKYMRARRRVEDRRTVSCQPHDFTTFAVLAIGQCIPTPGVLLMRRAAFERTGGFDQATAPSDDYDLCLALSRHGGLALVDQVLFGYRLHGANASDDKRSMHRSERTVRRKQIADSNNTPEQKRLLIAGFRLREQESYVARMRETWTGLRRREYVVALKTFLYGHANLVRALRGRP
jgi:glycosyltransferase involved in cell wall biosynthesis